LSEEKREEKAISRRKYLGAVGGLAAAAAVGWGLAGYLASRPPAPAAVRTVTETKTVTATPAVTTPITTPKPPEKKFKGIELRCALIGGGAYEALYELIPKFEEATGAKVDATLRLSHFELNKKLTLEFSARSPTYDVVSNHTSFFAAWKDHFEPLEDYMKEEDRRDFIERQLEASTIDDHLLIIPRHTDSRLVYYRTDLFNDPKEQEAFRKKYGYELNPPENWKQWRDIAEFFTRPPDLYGFVFTGKEEALTGTIYEATVAAGGNFFDEDWKPIFNEPPGVNALSHYVDLYRSGFTPEGVPTYLWDEVSSVFREGLIAFHFDWPGWYTLVKESKVGNKFDLALYPFGPAGIRAVWSGSHAFGINKYSKNKEAAWALIDFLTSAEAQYYESTKTGALPCRKSAWERIIADAEKSPDPRDAKRLKLLKEITEKYYLPVPKTGEWLKISDAFWPEAQRALLGEKTPKEALDDAAKKVYETMKEAGYYK
jgi:multiple sugar transport system substrate-binding protein